MFKSIHLVLVLLAFFSTYTVLAVKIDDASVSLDKRGTGMIYPRVSGLRKKATISRLTDYKCPRAFEEACSISISGMISQPQHDEKAFECLDTQNNIESCGGCIYAQVDQISGQDCTAIPNVATVSCQSGQCVIEECAQGYKLDENYNCTENDEVSKGLFGDW